jgi:hypothetical protein
LDPNYKVQGAGNIQRLVRGHFARVQFLQRVLAETYEGDMVKRSMKGMMGGRFHNWRERHFTIMQPEPKRRKELKKLKDEAAGKQKAGPGNQRTSLSRAGVVAAGAGEVTVSRRESRNVSKKCTWGVETGEDACAKWTVLGSKFCQDHVKAKSARESATTLAAIEIEKLEKKAAAGEVSEAEVIASIRKSAVRLSTSTAGQADDIMAVALREEAKMLEEEEHAKAAAQERAGGAGNAEDAEAEEEDHGEGGDSFAVGGDVLLSSATVVGAPPAATGTTGVTPSRPKLYSRQSIAHLPFVSDGAGDQYFLQWEKMKGKKKSMFRFKPAKGKLRLSPTASIVRVLTDKESAVNSSKHRKHCFMLRGYQNNFLTDGYFQANNDDERAAWIKILLTKISSPRLAERRWVTVGMVISARARVLENSDLVDGARARVTRIHEELGYGLKDGLWTLVMGLQREERERFIEWWHAVLDLEEQQVKEEEAKRKAEEEAIAAAEVAAAAAAGIISAAGEAVGGEAGAAAAALDAESEKDGQGASETPSKKEDADDSDEDEGGGRKAMGKKKPSMLRSSMVQVGGLLIVQSINSTSMVQVGAVINQGTYS